MKKRTKTTVTSTPQKSLRFAYANSNAQSVLIAGTFTDWTPTPMTKAGATWAKELPLKPGSYEYCFVVDGTWMADPAATLTTPNPFGGQNSVLTVN